MSTGKPKTPTIAPGIKARVEEDKTKIPNIASAVEANDSKDESDEIDASEVAGFIMNNRGNIGRGQKESKGPDWDVLKGKSRSMNVDANLRKHVLTLVSHCVDGSTLTVYNLATPGMVREAYEALFPESVKLTGNDLEPDMMTWQRWMAINGKLMLTSAVKSGKGWPALHEIFPPQTRFPGFGSVMSDKSRRLFGPLWVCVEALNCRARIANIDKIADKKKKIEKQVRIATFSLSSDTYPESVRANMDVLWHGNMDENLFDKTKWSADWLAMEENGHELIQQVKNPKAKPESVKNQLAQLKVSMGL